MNLQIRVLFLLSAFCLSWHPSHFNCSAAALVGDTEYGSIGQESEELDLFVIPSRGLKKSKGSKKAKSYKKSNSYDYRPIYQDSWNYESAYRPNRYSSSSSSSSDTRYSKSGKKGKKGKKSKGSKSYKRRPFIYKYKSFKKSKAFKKYPKNSFKRPERPEEPAEPTQTILEIAAETLDLSTLVSLLTSEGQEDLLETLKGEGPFTVFAPLNSAFDELFETVDPESLTDEEISNILAYHVVGSLIFEEDFIISESGIITAVNGDPIVFDVDDSEVTLNNEVLIVTADIIASNGVIHLVDKVLLPPDNTIITELQDANTFNTLLQLLDFANLDGFFDDPTDGPFTLFAPTDAAFADLLADLDVTLEEVLADPVALANILQYHVVDGLFGSGDLANLDSIETLQGESIEIDGTTLNSNTEITLADILASNGVIHVIDKVLIPGGDGNDATLPPDDVDDPDVDDPDIDDPDGGTGTNGTDATLDPIVDGVDQDGGTGTNNTDATLDPIDGGTDANNTDTNVDIVDDGTNSTNTTDDGVDTIDDIRGGGGGTNVLPRAVDQETTVPIDV